MKPSDYPVKVREFDTRHLFLFFSCFFFVFVFFLYFFSMGGGILCMYVLLFLCNTPPVCNHHRRPPRCPNAQSTQCTHASSGRSWAAGSTWYHTYVVVLCTVLASEEGMYQLETRFARIMYCISIREEGNSLPEGTATVAGHRVAQATALPSGGGAKAPFGVVAVADEVL